MSNTQQPEQDTTKQGFSLVELLFVMGIVFLLAGISLVNYNSFGREIDLENAAYDVALTVRTAQFFGINRNETSGADPGFDEPFAYGVYINTDTSDFFGVDAAERFMMYVDIEGRDNLFNNVTTSSPICTSNNSTECVDVFSLNRGNYISDICVGPNAANLTCGITELDITFTRPDPDALMYANGSDATQYAYAEIEVSSSVSGVSTKRVAVGAAGQISIR